jgi:hypothetical protein
VWRVKMSKSYKYAVVPTAGMYDSGTTVHVAYRTDDKAKAQAKAAKLGREYRRGMAPFGGSSGGYRVIVWGQDATTIDGYSLDRTPTAN